VRPLPADNVISAHINVKIATFCKGFILVLPSLSGPAFLFNGECKAYGSAQFSQLEILHRETGDVFTVAGGTSFRVAVTLEALVLYVQWVYVAVDHIIVTYQLYLSITYPLRVLYLGKLL